MVVLKWHTTGYSQFKLRLNRIKVFSEPSHSPRLSGNSHLFYPEVLKEIIRILTREITVCLYILCIFRNAILAAKPKIMIFRIARDSFDRFVYLGILVHLDRFIYERLHFIKRFGTVAIATAG